MKKKSSTQLKNIHWPIIKFKTASLKIQTKLSGLNLFYFISNKQKKFLFVFRKKKFFFANVIFIYLRKIIKFKLKFNFKIMKFYIYTNI